MDLGSTSLQTAKGEHREPCQSGNFTCCHGIRDELWTSWGWAHLAPGGTGQQERGSLGTSAGYPAHSCALGGARDSGQAACSEESTVKSKLPQRSKVLPPLSCHDQEK